MGMTTLLDLFRREFYEDRTIGELLINSEYFCLTLEDKVRGPMEKKIPGETAIPAQEYEVVLAWSRAFKRKLPRLLEVPGFSGVLIHGGNRPKDTQGCILVAFNRLVEAGSPIIQGSAEAELVERLVGLDRISLRIHNAGER